jgi:hypothetical protein
MRCEKCGDCSAEFGPIGTGLVQERSPLARWFGQRRMEQGFLDHLTLSNGLTQFRHLGHLFIHATNPTQQHQKSLFSRVVPADAQFAA